MTTYTCYIDTGWCGEVPLHAPVSAPTQKPETVFFTPPSITEDKPKPTSKPSGSRTHTGDGKAPQTDDKTQPGQTQLAGLGGTSTSHSNVPTPTPTADTSASARPTSHAAESIASSAPAPGGLSNGAVAGIAIATAVMGGAIAFLVAFVLFKKRRTPSSGHGYDSSTDFISTIKGGHLAYIQVSQTGPPPPTVAVALPKSKRSLDLSQLSSSSDFLAGVLSPGADEQTVRNRVTALLGQIQQHVDSFYRDVHATLTPSVGNDLKKFSDTRVNLADELEHSSVPTTTIKHALTKYILRIVAPEAGQQSTLFPTEVAGLKEGERCYNSPDDQAAYVLYRRLAAHLHAPPTSSIQSRQSDIREAAEHFALPFFPWANPVYADQDKDENLVDVINNALDVSLWLFGQPYLYEWKWEEVGRRGTVIAPALVRITDERGANLDTPIRIVDAAVAVD